VPTASVSAATTASITNSAGSSRRARRHQNSPRRIRPVRSRSPISNDVMRKPEMTKNTSTPIHPPRIHPNPAW
jgi:hypothetical protein